MKRSSHDYEMLTGKGVSMASTIVGYRPRVERAAGAPLSLWRNRDYMLLWSGQLVSSLGSGVSTIAFPLLVLALTHSAMQAGITGALAMVPYLVVSLPAGVLVDRWDRKRVMILCDSGRALALASIPIAALIGHVALIQIYLVSLAEGTFFVFFSLAQTACLPRVVPQEQLPTASAQNEGGAIATGLVAPPLGGALFQSISQSAPFLLDGISYVASVISLLFVKTEFQASRTATPRNVRAEIAEGVAWLWRNPLIRYMAFLTGGMNAAVAALYLTLIVLATNQHASSGSIGLMFAVVSVGGVLGSLLAPRVQRRFRFGQVVIALFWAEALLWPLFAVAPNLLLLGMIAAGVYALGPVYNAVQLTYRLALIPDELQGRVNGAYRLVAYGCHPLGIALSGVLIQAIGPVSTVLVFAGWVAVLAALTTLNPHVRQAAPIAVASDA
ncbi:MAG TPA: MFS transporter [Chloroflexota bacterium]|nr:MFS transporter [Chloroflexota bacterium]